MINEEVIRLRISIQNALIGKITKEVRGVYVKVKNNCIYLYIVVDGETSDYWKEMIYEIGTDLISHFDENYNISENLIRLDYPNILYFKDYICVYKRYESPVMCIS